MSSLAQPADGTDRPHRSEPVTTVGRATDEFPPEASVWPADLSRRDFLQVMAASIALAELSGCNRPPSKTIVPYVTAPERALADGPVYYATAMSWEGYGRGLLARSNSGRPTKLDGNPAHPESLGATDAITQAAVLSLYDPDRSKTPRYHGAPIDWAEFQEQWLTEHARLQANHGAGFAVLTEPTTSPTVTRMIHRLLDRFPSARWYQHTPLARYDRDGRQDDYDFTRADVILAIEADFLLQHPASLRYTRAFSGRRRIENGRVNANRLYVIEAGPTLTGSMADHRLPASPHHARRLLAAIENALDHRPIGNDLSAVEQRTVEALAADLQAKAPNVVCVAGVECDDDIRAWADAINVRLHADGVTWHSLPSVRSDPDRRCAGDLAAAVRAIHDGQIRTLIIAGCNPAYTAPADLQFATALEKVPLRIHLGTHVDETAVACDWHIPESHFLECWSDVRAYDGTASIIQPLISPLYASRSLEELLSFLNEPPGRDGYDLVRETWQANRPSADFEQTWNGWLNTGLVDGTQNSRSKPSPPARAVGLQTSTSAPAVTVLIRPDPTIRDGRWANNGWLQELPKQNSQMVWDNAMYVSLAFAERENLTNGDEVELRRGSDRLRAPAWIAPGLAADCVVIHLGYGRTRAGRVGDNRGFDAYRFRRSHRLWSDDLDHVAPAHGHGWLVSTQTHFTMEGRDIVRTASAADPAHTAGLRPRTEPSLYPDWSYPSYRWAMLIDLGTCIGCKACVLACQAENNIPVVGKDQVARGREMHWIRVDRYFEGDPQNPQVLHQPVPCMQCETAPCELVCPVAATVHSSEGLNDMVYNRCVGTRYCSNNCPYKVRRFNFLNFQPPKDSPLYLQKNPDVTVRARGVMEKCTYCVQRIDAGRITAEKANRRVRDGEIRTACQDACPAEAIVFGDLSDPQSLVSRRKREPTEYALLEELNTRPRTTYLARLRNQNPALVGHEVPVRPNDTTNHAARGPVRSYLAAPDA
ncbi:MAG TPA: TAT-variant-translocated molybdopterin oxidoreductase [Opitutaceae bacterium]|nr:TAT-variant-translocated molybdopterin oxidoreductase [Opitutaceae bacterium]